MNLFDIDSPFNRYMSMAFDVMLIGLLWFITSIPVLTTGASTCAAYSVMMLRISDREQTIVKAYFSAFKKNFKYPTILFNILLVFFAANLINFLYMQASGTAAVLLYAFHLLIAGELIFLYIHAFPLMTRFEMRFLEMVRTALIFAHKHLLTTVTHVVLIVAILFLTYEFFPLLFVAFGLYCWLSSLMFIRLYRQYRPELDKDNDDNDEDSAGS